MLAALFILLFNAPFLRENPFFLHCAWESPSYVSASGAGHVIVVDQSKTRVRISDAQYRVAATIYGGDIAEESFYYAEYTATDGESVYIADVTHRDNSSRVARERVLRFSMTGKYLETLWDVSYPEGSMPLQLGTIRGLSASHGTVYFLRREADTSLTLYSSIGGVHSIRTIGAQGEVVAYASYAPATDSVAFSTMQSGLFYSRGDVTTRLAYGDGVNVLTGVAVGNSGVFVCDLLNESIVSITDGDASAVFPGNIHFVSACGDKLAFTDNQSVYITTRNGAPLFADTRMPLAPLYYIRVLLVWLSAACLLAAGLWLLYYCLRIAYRNKRTTAGGALAIGVSILLTAALIGAYMISFYQNKLRAAASGDLRRSASFLSETSGETFGDPFSRLNALNDYDNADYRQVRAYLDSFCEQGYRNGLNMYYILLKFDAAQNTIWGVMDYENTNGVVYPYMPYTGSGYDAVAESGDALLVESESDAFGTWTYVVVPVYDSAGQTAGLLEIGANRHSELLSEKKMINNVITATLAAVIMMLLLLNEAADYRRNLALRAKCAARHETSAALGFLRCIMFLVFLGDNLDASFIPQLSSRLFVASGMRMDVNVAAALPMSAQLLSIATAAVAGGALLDRKGIKAIMTTGALVRVLGAALSVVAVSTESFLLFTAAKLIGGLGTGAMIVSCNALPSCTAEESEQESLFAGLNIGSMAGVVLGASLGGYAAQYLGYVAGYICAAGLMLLCLAATLSYIEKSWRPATQQKDAPHTLRGVAAALKKPPIFGFFAFILIPFMVMLYFKDYVFPLFGASIGHDESDIGNILLLGGVIAIFLGGVLPQRIFRRIGVRKAMMLASFLTVCALLLFTLRESYLAAACSVCLMGLASSFGMTAQGVYISQAARREGIGVGVAMGMYSLTDNFGQACGPLVLGAMLHWGYGKAMGIAAVACAILLGLFTLLTGKESKDKNTEYREDSINEN
ncbi:MAG: MFS transporter [Eubacteriales bacterium]|nr:MFS transporter [Eubacteriales bacterium]